MSTKGGFAETEVKELTVIPCGAPAASVRVATAIPVAKRAQERRKESKSTEVGDGILDKGLTSILSWGFVPGGQGFDQTGYHQRSSEQNRYH